MSFDAYFDCERFFSHVFIAENCQKWVSLTFVDSSKNFLPGCTNNKSEVGFVMLTGLPVEAVERFSGNARS